jgi:hypothetical protein
MSNRRTLLFYRSLFETEVEQLNIKLIEVGIVDQRLNRLWVLSLEIEVLQQRDRVVYSLV